jgi:hypothetical protein
VSSCVAPQSRRMARVREHEREGRPCHVLPA